MAFDQFATYIQRCLERINDKVAEEIQGSYIQVLSYRDGERISLALVVDNVPVATNFILEEECFQAFGTGTIRSALIDRFTRNWIRVVRVKLDDDRSLAELGRKAQALLSQPQPLTSIHAEVAATQ